MIDSRKLGFFDLEKRHAVYEARIQTALWITAFWWLLFLLVLKA